MIFELVLTTSILIIAKLLHHECIIMAKKNKLQTFYIKIYVVETNSNVMHNYILRYNHWLCIIAMICCKSPMYMQNG